MFHFTQVRTTFHLGGGQWPTLSSAASKNVGCLITQVRTTFQLREGSAADIIERTMCIVYCCYRIQFSVPLKGGVSGRHYRAEHSTFFGGPFCTSTTASSTRGSGGRSTTRPSSINAQSKPRAMEGQSLRGATRSVRRAMSESGAKLATTRMDLLFTIPAANVPSVGRLKDRTQFSLQQAGLLACWHCL